MYDTEDTDNDTEDSDNDTNDSEIIVEIKYNDEDTDSDSDINTEENNNNKCINTSDLDNFLTTSDDPVTINKHEDDVVNDFIPMINTSEEPFEVTKEILKSHYVSGHVILNQCGSICVKSR